MGPTACREIRNKNRLACYAKYLVRAVDSDFILLVFFHQYWLDWISIDWLKCLDNCFKPDFIWVSSWQAEFRLHLLPRRSCRSRIVDRGRRSASFEWNHKSVKIMIVQPSYQPAPLKMRWQHNGQLVELRFIQPIIITNCTAQKN